MCVERFNEFQNHFSFSGAEFFAIGLPEDKMRRVPRTTIRVESTPRTQLTRFFVTITVKRDIVIAPIPR